MIKNLGLRLLTKVGLLLTVIALTKVSTCSIWYFYEPEAPECLKNKS